ncbi:hypothetical protein VTN77DRAFT_666 [Rasamsonia byssochlamydoides]|uniref:uncharacterized protein n=1 Tax=Rasamsonia byssochlamydoides TaxID=89139 RepID=UPI0037444518
MCSKECQLAPKQTQTQTKTQPDGNHLNVYTGPDSVKKYFDPDCQPPLPLVEIPRHLNPFYDDGVRIYAKMMSMHPANNVKSLPALNMLQSSVSPSTKTIVEYSSGSTVISMAMIARIFHGITDVRAYLSNKTSAAKLRLMQFFGLDLTLFGGPSQPQPLDARGGIQNARLQAQTDDSIINPNQYENDLNWQAHVRWTGPQIFKQLPQINVICAGMGTSGTMTGLGTYFKQTKPSVYRLGVCTAAGDRVPGPRSYALLQPVEFPWRAAVDTIEEVGSYDSFSLSLELCRAGLICGPSSGFNLQGLCQMLEKRRQSGSLGDLAGPDGLIHCVFLCCDLPYQYIDEYFHKLGAEKFHPIRNERLAQVDLYRYDDSWEQNPVDVLDQFYESSSYPAIKANCSVIDLRQPADFETWHLPGAVNIPINSLDARTPSPFSDAAVLEAQWRELDALFAPESSALSALTGRKVMLVCYGRDTARVATSVLRAREIEAYSVRGGYQAIAQMDLLQNSQKSNHVLTPPPSRENEKSTTQSIVTVELN